MDGASVSANDLNLLEANTLYKCNDDSVEFESESLVVRMLQKQMQNVLVHVEITLFI